MIITANAQWVAQTSGAGNFLTSVHFPTSTTGYVSQENGFIRKTIDGGTNWNAVGGPTTIYGPIQFTSINTGFAVSPSNGVLKTVDGGLTWVDNFTNDHPGGGTCGMHFPTSSIGYSASTNGSTDSIIVDKTIDSGNSWFQVAKFPSYGLPFYVYFINSTTGFIAAETDALYKTTDGGISWNVVLNDPTTIAVHFPSASIGYTVGDAGQIWKSTDGGGSWSEQFPTTTLPWYGVYFTSINTGYVVGGDGFNTGVILQTINGGTTWTTSFTGTNTFNSVFFPLATEGYACGLGGDIHKYTIASLIEKTDELNNFSIYPNPSSGKFNITNSDFSSAGKTNISISDLTGNLVYSKSMENSQLNFDISNQPKGVYFVKIENENGVVMKKIICQ